MSTKRYEIGVIGCGKIWEIGHWKGLQEMPDEARVRYVYDTDEARARQAAEQSGAACLQKPEAIFDDEAVDIVAILTPPLARVDYVRQACQAGKHLMLEKPMARTLEAALEIRRLIVQAGVKCFIPFMRTMNAPARQLAEQVRSGAFGEPLAFVHTFLGTPYPWIALDHWMHDQVLSGGPIFDYSIHFLELARACLGEAASVLYGGAALTGRVRSDDHAALLVHYADGGLGQFTKSWDFPPGCKYGHQTTHVVCRDAVLVIGKAIEAHTSDGRRELDLGRDAAGGRAESYRNLIAAIERGAPLHADELNGLRMNEILDGMERSRASGRREPVVLHDEPMA
jgi:predicted dehydrogenase